MLPLQENKKIFFSKQYDTLPNSTSRKKTVIEEFLGAPVQRKFSCVQFKV
jgi:hypothetical protein